MAGAPENTAIRPPKLDRANAGRADLSRYRTAWIDAATKSNLTPRGGGTDAPQGGDLAQLRQSLDEVRGNVAALAARVGEGAVWAGGRGLQQARQVAGEVTEEVADRADEGVDA